MNGTFNPGLLIPLVAIIFGVMIPIVSIIMDFRRRKLLSEERRAMIEKGMVPPEVDERSWGERRPRDHDAERARSLRAGITMLTLGIGLGVAFYIVQYVAPEALPRHAPRIGLAIAASIVGFLGVGNLIYYVVSDKKQK